MTNPCLFIVGCQRSGTTLLKRMLNAHPRLAVTSESNWIARLFENRAGVTPQGLVSPELLSFLAADPAFLRLNIGRKELETLSRPGQQVAYAEFVSGIFNLYGKTQGKALVGNKTPAHVRRLHTLHALWPEARFVHLVRDGRVVCLSMLGPELYYEMRYESLVEQPAEEIAALCAFLGLPYDRAMLSFHEGRTIDDPKLESKQRWLPATLGLRDWRSEMTEEQVERFEAAVGPLLDTLGYPRAFSRPSPERLDHASRLRALLAQDPGWITLTRKTGIDSRSELMTSSYADILKRIEAALCAAREVFDRFTAGAIEAEFKAGHDPVTEADRAIDAVLRENLLRNHEGWLSEESVDDLSRLDKKHVWVVDPLDGTREFVKGIPEFCVSIGFVENGRPVAGGICNPATRETFIGAVDAGVLYNGKPVHASQRTALNGAIVLASRSEIKRGEWQPFEGGQLQVRAMGSVAYKLALVSAGLADITFTLSPKNEWDVTAGAALVLSSGGFVSTLENAQFHANNKNPLLSGFIAGGAHLRNELLALVEPHIQAAASKTGK